MREEGGATHHYTEIGITWIDSGPVRKTGHPGNENALTANLQGGGHRNQQIKLSYSAENDSKHFDSNNDMSSMTEGICGSLRSKGMVPLH